MKWFFDPIMLFDQTGYDEKHNVEIYCSQKKSPLNQYFFNCFCCTQE